MTRQEYIEKRIRLGKMIYRGSVVVGILAFIFLLGMAGRSDYCTEANIEDTWTTFDYFIRGIICVLVMFGCRKSADIGTKIRSYHYVESKEGSRN